MLFVGRKAAQSYPDLTVHCGGVTIVPKGTGTIRLLGLHFDSGLCFETHVNKIRQSCQGALHNLHWANRFLSLPQSRQVFQATIVSRLLHGAYIFYQYATHKVRSVLDRIFAEGCRCITGTSRTASTNSCIAEAGYRSFAFLVERQGTRRVTVALSLPHTYGVWSALRRKSNAPQLRNTPRRYCPVQDFRYIPPVFAFPYLASACEDSLKVRFLLQASSNRTAPEEERLKASLENLKLVGPCDAEVWTDGSYVSSAVAGSAALLYLNSTGEVISSVGRSHQNLSCVFPAETYGILDGLNRALYWAQGRTTRPHIGVFSDSLSTLQMLSVGPLRQRLSFGSDIWQSLLILVRHADVSFGFVYSHCGVPRNVAADSGANAAASLPASSGARVWSVDMANICLRPIREKHDATWVLGSLYPPFARGPSDIPRLDTRGDYILLSQLRTGVCPSLGGTKHHQIEACPRCGELSLARGGLAVKHLFSCPAAATLRTRFPFTFEGATCLWAEPDVAVRYARTFMLLPATDPVQVSQPTEGL
jgi:ribonuclease HI